MLVPRLPTRQRPSPAAQDDTSWLATRAAEDELRRFQDAGDYGRRAVPLPAGVLAVTREDQDRLDAGGYAGLEVGRAVAHDERSVHLQLELLGGRPEHARP